MPSSQVAPSDAANSNIAPSWAKNSTLPPIRSSTTQAQQLAVAKEGTTTQLRQPQPGLCPGLQRCFGGLIECSKRAYGSDGQWGKCLKGMVFTYQGFMFFLDIADIVLDYATVAELSGMGFKWHAVWLGKLCYQTGMVARYLATRIVYLCVYFY